MKKRSKIKVLLDESEFRWFEGFGLERGHKKSTLIARLNRDHLNSPGFTIQEDLPLAGQPVANASGGSR